MNTLTVNRSIRVLPFLIILAWLAMTSAVNAQDRGATLTISAPESAPAGSTMELVATLTDQDGTPIGDELIDFKMSVEFMSNSGEIHVGSGQTDGAGVARIEYIPRAEGDHYLSASSAEESDITAFAEMEMKVTAGPQLYNELSPVRVPGANVWMTSAVLLVIWSVFVLMALKIWQIARIGEREGGNSDA